MNIQVIQDINSFKSIEQKWLQLLEKKPVHSIFQTWLWHYIWWKHFGKELTLYILTVFKDDGTLFGIAPLCFDQKKSTSKVLQFIGGKEVTDYMDFIVMPGWEKPFFKVLTHYLVLQEKEMLRLDLQCIPEASATLKTFTISGYETKVFSSETCPILEFPKTWEDYMESLSKKDRHEIRRKMNKVMRETEAFMMIPDKNDFKKALKTFFRLHKKSSPDKSLFMDEKNVLFFSELAEAFIEEKWLELPILTINNKVLAAIYVFLYRNTVYIYNSGYDPAYSRWSPGIVLLSLYIKKSIERGMDKIDFLRGNEPYKYGFGTEDYPLYRMQIWKEEQ